MSTGEWILIPSEEEKREPAGPPMVEALGGRRADGYGAPPKAESQRRRGDGPSTTGPPNGGDSVAEPTGGEVNEAGAGADSGQGARAMRGWRSMTRQ